MAQPFPSLQADSQAVPASGRFSHRTYTVRKKIFSFLGQRFHIFDPEGNVVLFSKMKAFKLKEDIRLYTGEDMQEEVFRIQARSIIDFSATYDVMDSYSGQKIGALRRKGLKSLVKDEWLVLNAQDQEIGLIQEDNFVLSLLRRFICNLVPQHFHVFVQGQPVAEYHQNFNPFVLKLQLDFSQDEVGGLDRRLGLAAAVLLCAIDG